jgi:S1-C subfamily serine protease
MNNPIANILSGLLGGLVVLVLGAILISTDVIDTGDSSTVVRQSPITQTTADGGDGNGRTVGDIYRQEARGVVFVESEGVSSESSPFGSPEQGTATGSGFVVDEDGTILTNAHVVSGADSVKVSFSEDGDAIDAEVKGVDESSDLAVLKIDPSEVENLVAMPLGDSSQAEVGDPVVAIGNPFGLQRTATTGIVSAVQREITAPNGFQIRDVIQTDASINPGNSGGPLLDANGRVIGINSQIATGGTSQGSVGIGFAVPINTAKSLLPELRQGGEIKHAYLGVTMADVDEGVAQDLDLPADHGALIQDVVQGGPADDAGLRGGGSTSGDVAAGGDLLVKVDGEEIERSDDVAAAIDDNQPGDEIEVEYYRGDELKTAKVQLGERPDASAGSEQQQPEDDGGGGLFPLP